MNPLRSTRVFDCPSQIEVPCRNDRKNGCVLFTRAEDVSRQFMIRVAVRNHPHQSLVRKSTWWNEGLFTSKVTGKVRVMGPSMTLAQLNPNDLADELIVPMGDLKVAIRLPEDLQSADRLKFDSRRVFRPCRSLISELSFFSLALKSRHMSNTRLVDPEISFSPRGEDYIRRFMEAVND